MSKTGSDLFKYTSGANAALVQELTNSDAKCNPSDIVGITKDPKGNIVWLENGTSSAGLNHILAEHEGDFNNQGVTTEELPTFILEAVHQGNVVGTQGKGPRARTVYEFTYEGKPRRVAVQIGSNGFIVSANPKSMKGE
jgi:filamentous hemagglutinin